MNNNLEIEQQLHNYEDKYTNYGGWLRTETPHYIFHYMAGSKAETDIKDIAERQEKAFSKIITQLKIDNPDKKIRYYIYPDSAVKEKYMGDGGNAQAVYRDFSIHVVYSDGVDPLGEHEDTHLLSLGLGLPIGILHEGLAEYMADGRTWGGKDDAFWIKEGLEKNILFPLSSMMTQDAWLDRPDEYAPYDYIFSKKLVLFLVKSFGWDKFMSLYKEMTRKNNSVENIKVLEKICDTSLENLEQQWRTYLVTHS